MAFWQLNHCEAAVIDADGRVWTYAQLSELADGASAIVAAGAARDVAFLLFEPRIEAVAHYIGALRCRAFVPLVLQSTITEDQLGTLAESYAPAWIAQSSARAAPPRYRLAHDHGGYAVFAREFRSTEAAPHEDCGLLLSTSGSTGSPKLVRLSYAAIAANAASIAAYLHLTPADRAITTLPLGYSFGLSILNSHFEAGGSLVLNNESVLSRRFWDTAAKLEVTSLSGVPSTYEMLYRARIETRGLSRLRALTQAGGALRHDLIRHFATMARAQSWSFFVMYGQTEASPRISYVPPARLLDKIGSIGIPVPGGSLGLDEASSELVYRGPNVMMGYAESRADLVRGDECRGALHTGDLARRDEDGFYFLTGRAKRIIKLSGARLNLDEIELALGGMLKAPVACIGEDDRLVIAHCAAVSDDVVIAHARQAFNIFAGYVTVARVEEIPSGASGKPDYKALSALVRTQTNDDGNVRI